MVQRTLLFWCRNRVIVYVGKTHMKNWMLLYFLSHLGCEENYKSSEEHINTARNCPRWIIYTHTHTHTEHYFPDLFTYEVLLSMKTLLHPKGMKVHIHKKTGIRMFIASFFFKNFYFISLFIYLFIYLAASGLSCGTWDLSLWHTGSLVEARELSSWGTQA